MNMDQSPPLPGGPSSMGTGPIRGAASSSPASLDEIGLLYGTDKSSVHHDYLVFYDKFFGDIRHEKLKVLEVGVLNGASLSMWKHYFQNGSIVGADIMPTAIRFETDRIAIELIDQSNIEDLTRLAVKHGPFDIIIEDGSHMWEHQITSLRTLFPYVKDTGFYIVEDLQTNYGDMIADYRGISSVSCVDYLMRLLELRVADDKVDISKIEDPFLRTYGRGVEFMTFYRRACLIKKLSVVDPAGSPLLPVGKPASERVAIIAHISHKGDVTGRNGYVTDVTDSFPFQGLSLFTSKQILEYRVRVPGGSWTEWAEEGQFVGSRGVAKLLTGVTVRLKAAASGTYSLRLACKFQGQDGLVEVGSGEDCVPAEGTALYGIHIVVSAMETQRHG